MNSKWAGAASGVFFNPNKFDRSRTLNLAETKFNKGLAAKGYYVMGVDVGRTGDLTEAVIIKVTPAPTGVPVKQIVNIFTLEAEHFEKQAIQLKRLFNAFKCEICVLDGNGLGIGLVDELVKDQIDPDTNELLANWGVQNDDDRRYKEWQTEDTIHNALYIMKANVPINSELYAYCQNQLNNGKLRFLIDEAAAKNKLLGQVQGQKMTAAQRADYLRPYVETSILKSQMLNLIQENEGANIILKKSANKIKKDKFSALIYGLSWCMQKERRNKKRGGRDLSKLMLFTQH